MRLSAKVLTFPSSSEKPTQESKAPTLKLSLEKENEEQSLWLPTYLSWVVSHTFAKSMSQGASLVAQRVKNPPTKQETRVQSLSQEDPLKKGMTTLSSILAWRIPWTEDPGGLKSMGLQRVRHD